MNLAGFCATACRAGTAREAGKQGIEVTDEQAREDRLRHALRRVEGQDQKEARATRKKPSTSPAQARLVFSSPRSGEVPEGRRGRRSHSAGRSCPLRLRPPPQRKLGRRKPLPVIPVFHRISVIEPTRLRSYGRLTGSEELRTCRTEAPFPRRPRPGRFGRPAEELRRADREARGGAQGHRGDIQGRLLRSERRRLRRQDHAQGRVTRQMDAADRAEQEACSTSTGTRWAWSEGLLCAGGLGKSFPALGTGAGSPHA